MLFDWNFPMSATVTKFSLENVIGWKLEVPDSGEILL